MDSGGGSSVERGKATGPFDPKRSSSARAVLLWTLCLDQVAQGNRRMKYRGHSNCWSRTLTEARTQWAVSCLNRDCAFRRKRSRFRSKAIASRFSIDLQVRPTRASCKGGLLRIAPLNCSFSAKAVKSLRKLSIRPLKRIRSGEGVSDIANTSPGLSEER